MSIVKRHKVLLLVALIMLLVVSGCGGSKPTGETETADTGQHLNDSDQPDTDGYVYGTPITVDDVVFTITECSVASIEGDRTKDNVAEENGEYFAIGSDIVKVADYEQVELSIMIENKKDKAITFSEVGWEAKLPDGYKLENITVEGKIGEQMPSNYKGEGKIVIVKEKAIKAETMQLTYNLMDYNEEWKEAIWKAVAGEMTEEQYKNKFNPKPVVFELKVE